MKIIQSLWTKPVLENPDKIDGGWLDKKYHYYSCALSCLQLRKYYEEVELYTDQLGKYLLIDQLNLPYTRVHVVLDQMNTYSTQLFSVGKIYACKLQTEPFLHVDNDIIIWDRFKSHVETASFATQEEEASDEFRQFILQAEQYLRYVPDYIRDAKQKLGEKTPCYNTGIIGGHDVAFIAEYAEESLRFMNENYDGLPSEELKRLFIVFAEQYLLYWFTVKHQVAVGQLTRNYYQTLVDDDVRRIAAQLKYVHLMGITEAGWKQDENSCFVLEQWLFMHYPDYYFHIQALLKNHQI